MNGEEKKWKKTGEEEEEKVEEEERRGRCAAAQVLTQENTFSRSFVIKRKSKETSGSLCAAAHTQTHTVQEHSLQEVAGNTFQNKSPGTKAAQKLFLKNIRTEIYMNESITLLG